MKNLIFYCIYILILSLCYSKKSNAQQVYTIPWAVQQPQWVFPIWFEDGIGRRDTVYICYDSLAHTSQYQDSLFGYFWNYQMSYDTNKFNMGNLPNSLPCSTQPCPMSKIYLSTSSGNILFDYFQFSAGNKINYPLKVYYDVNMLNSPALPWTPAGLNYKKAQAYALFFDQFTYFSSPSLCGTSQYVLMSDSVSPQWFLNYACLAKDSIIWNSNIYNYGFAQVTFNIEKWTGWPAGGVGIERNYSELINVILINNIAIIKRPLEYFKVFDINGKLIYNYVNKNSDSELNLSLLKNAIYIIETKSKGELPVRNKLAISN